MDLLRLWHTVRHLRPVQIYARIWFRFYRPAPNLSPAPALAIPSTAWVSPPQRVISFQPPATFTFLNQTHTLQKASDWNNPQWDKLWLYNLHYFDDLNALDAPQRMAAHQALTKRWIQENPPADGNGWEPYPLSLRIVNWIKWIVGAVGVIQPAVVQHSLAVQVRYLRKRLEYHLLGNHLFANAKALTFAGLFFSGAEAEEWLVKGLNLLQREMAEQILPDGGHFERSPMYHSIILEDILDLINLATVYPNRIPTTQIQTWWQTTQNMLVWLSAMTHPDGEIALFNDAALGIASTPAEINAYAKRLTLIPPFEKGGLGGISSPSGYARLENSSAVLLADVGEIGPDYLPGHAHADTLSFELSLFGQRVIVDSGISCYGNSTERLRQRSTAAHNTVEIDGQSSSEVWGGFRVARRAKPCQVEFRQDQEIIILKAGHDGYQRLHKDLMHWREWRLDNHSLTINDQVTGTFTQAIGRLLFAPDIRITPSDEPNVWMLHLPQGQTVRLEVLHAEVELLNTTYHPRFGVSEQAKGLVYKMVAGNANCKLC
jgi:uncharacterized heparinase superfamily protein